MGDPRREIEALFNEYGSGVGRYFRARVGSPELAEELTAQVFLKVVHKYHQLRGSPVAWLWAIVRTELARYYRDRKEHTAVETDPLHDADSPVEQMSAEEVHRKLRIAMENLTEEQQTIIYFKFFQQMRNGDIARAIGLSATNVSTIVHRALQLLRAWMESDTLAEKGGTVNGAIAPQGNQQGLT